MPYCPKCDMEFIDGITICSDCGGPLLESVEAAKALKEQEKAKQDRWQADDLDEAHSEYEKEYPNQEYQNPPEHENQDFLRLQESEESFTPVGIYVKKSDKYQEMKSSASAFLLVGSAILVFTLLCWLRIINLPMVGLSKILFQSVLTAMGTVFLLVSIFTYKSAASLSSQIEEENKKTEELLNWFTDRHTGESLDQRLGEELSGLSPEELSLKRFEFIQDILITSHDIPDQAYVDSLSEDIYSRLYESSSKSL